MKILNNNIQEAYCSLEVSKLLKEKGFDDECKYYYDINEDLNIHIGYIGDVWRNSEIENGLPYHKEKYKSPCISAPTIAEVVMWLYEKHGIWIYVDFYNENRWFGVFRNKEGVKTELFDVFNSPTEAYEAAIEYTIKNLI